MDLLNKKVLIIGSGISGIGAAKLLDSIGALPVIYDENVKLSVEAVRRKLPRGMNAQVVIGSLPHELRKEIVLLVPSPGVPVDTDLVESFQKDKIPVWGEVELGYRYGRGRLVAITGTNGKTTTTSLVGQIMQEYYHDVYIVGNIGNPYTEAAPVTTEESVTVAEISSFQLETAESFRPHVSAILNITPDHLNRHHTMENYAAVKQRIASNQTKQDVCVLNYGDKYTRAFGDICPARVIFFSSAGKLERGIYLDGELICMADENGVRALMNIHDMNLVGMCNVENVMAAIAVCDAMNVPVPNILDTIRRFKAVEHRIEFVATKNGVDYYNDSKGTNPDAAIQGIKAMTKPTVLIAGGYDKQSEYDEWIEAFENKVKCLVLIGQTADKIEACARKHGVKDIVRADGLREALDFCIKSAAPGDAVLLSPACASWGMFPDYEVRGQNFKDYVYNL